MVAILPTLFILFVKIPLEILIYILNYPKILIFISLTAAIFIKDNQNIIRIYQNLIVYFIELLSIYIVIIIQSIYLIKYITTYIYKNRNILRNQIINTFKVIFNTLIYFIKFLFNQFINLIKLIFNCIDCIILSIFKFIKFICLIIFKFIKFICIITFFKDKSIIIVVSLINFA